MCNEAMNLQEIGLKILERREHLGLTQDRLAKLCGLSRSTINHLENGSLNDLGISKILVVLNILGINLLAEEIANKPAALEMTSRTASVSYKNKLMRSELEEFLATGVLPEKRLAHIATILDEAPIPLIVSAVEETAKTRHISPKKIWKHLNQCAREIQSPRLAWS